MGSVRDQDVLSEIAWIDTPIEGEVVQRLEAAADVGLNDESTKNYAFCKRIDHRL